MCTECTFCGDHCKIDARSAIYVYLVYFYIWFGIRTTNDIPATRDQRGKEEKGERRREIIIYVQIYRSLSPSRGTTLIVPVSRYICMYIKNIMMRDY